MLCFIWGGGDENFLKFKIRVHLTYLVFWETSQIAHIRRPDVQNSIGTMLLRERLLIGNMSPRRQPLIGSALRPTLGRCSCKYLLLCVDAVHRRFAHRYGPPQLLPLVYNKTIHTTLNNSCKFNDILI